MSGIPIIINAGHFQTLAKSATVLRGAAMADSSGLVASKVVDWIESEGFKPEGRFARLKFPDARALGRIVSKDRHLERVFSWLVENIKSDANLNVCCSIPLSVDGRLTIVCSFSAETSMPAWTPLATRLPMYVKPNNGYVLADIVQRDEKLEVLERQVDTLNKDVASLSRSIAAASERIASAGRLRQRGCQGNIIPACIENQDQREFMSLLTHAKRAALMDIGTSFSDRFIREFTVSIRICKADDSGLTALMWFASLYMG